MSQLNQSTTISQSQITDLILKALHGRSLDDKHSYKLSVAISDLSPDQALRSIASALREIIAPYLGASATIMAMDIECSRMIEDLTDLDCDQNSALNAPETIECVIEDLEYIDELLNLASDFFTAKDPVASKLCTLLKAQSHCQSLILETASSTLASQSPAIQRPSASIIAFPPRRQSAQMFV